MFFESTLRLFEAYFWCHVDAGTPKFDEHLAHEVRERLRQLSFLYDEIMALETSMLEKEYSRSGRPAPGQIRKFIHTNLGRFVRPHEDGYAEYGPGSPFSESAQLRLRLENFYYVAHRILCLVQDSRLQLPGISGLSAAGVRSVRNHLVEHPTKKKGNRISSYAFGGPVGPQLKPLSDPAGPAATFDEGLYANARQFRDNFERVLRTGLRQAGRAEAAGG